MRKKRAVSCQCGRAQGRNCYEGTSTVAALVQGHRSHEAKGGSPRTRHHQHLPFSYRHGQQLESKLLQNRDEE